MNASNVFSATAKAGLNISQADLLALAASDPTAYYALKEEVAQEVTKLDAARQRFAEDGAQAQTALTALQSAQEELAAGQERLVADMVRLTTDQATLAALQVTLNEANAQLTVDKEQFQGLVNQLGNDRAAFENEKMVHAANAQKALTEISERQTYLDRLSADLAFQESTLELKATAWRANKEHFINQLREWSI